MPSNKVQPGFFEHENKNKNNIRFILMESVRFSSGSRNVAAQQNAHVQSLVINIKKY